MCRGWCSWQDKKRAEKYAFLLLDICLGDSLAGCGKKPRRVLDLRACWRMRVNGRHYIKTVIPAEAGIQARFMRSLVATKNHRCTFYEVLIGISLDGLALCLIILFRPSASVFSLRAKRKGTKRKGTLASAFFLRCSPK
jgi:hypothetical protein